MKLITLNTWGGKLHDPLLTFIREKSDDTDIFCLQEVFNTETELVYSNGAKMNLYKDLTESLPQMKPFFGRKSVGYDYSGYRGLDLHFGNSMFVNSDLSHEGYEELFEDITHPNHDWTKTAPPKAQIVKLNIKGKPVVVCNFHGIWINGSGKKDTPERIEQARQLKDKLNSYDCDVILCGDFNLLPETESIKILESGMTNLISKHGISSTRSSYYGKDVGYADYVLVTPGIEVKNFKVLNEEVSDHLPLLLEFT